MPYKSKQVVQALQRLGFKFARQKGSHLHLKNDFGNRVSIPIHAGDLKTGTLHSILKQAGISLDQLRENI